MHANPTKPFLLRSVCLLLPTALLSACGSHKVARQDPPPIEQMVEIKAPVLDGRGAYRFHMSDGERRLSADEFDAWMKANGIRVAKGNSEQRAAQPVVVASKESAKDKKKKKK